MTYGPFDIFAFEFTGNQVQRRDLPARLNLFETRLSG